MTSVFNGSYGLAFEHTKIRINIHKYAELSEAAITSTLRSINYKLQLCKWPGVSLSHKSGDSLCCWVPLMTSLSVIFSSSSVCFSSTSSNLHSYARPPPPLPSTALSPPGGHGRERRRSRVEPTFICVLSLLYRRSLSLMWTWCPKNKSKKSFDHLFYCWVSFLLCLLIKTDLTHLRPCAVESCVSAGQEWAAVVFV